MLLLQARQLLPQLVFFFLGHCHRDSGGPTMHRLPGWNATGRGPARSIAFCPKPFKPRACR
jgi:hypothetical protein